MNTLPTEIILSINNFLNTKDFIALSLVNSRLNKCSKIDKNTWRTRTFFDYQITLPDDTLNFKKKYIYYYNNLCILCYKKTSIIHPMKKVRVCNNCQQTRDEYTMITTKTAKKQYFLTSKDFKDVEYCEKPNPWNKDRPIKFFLKSELLTRFSSKFPSKIAEEEYKQKKRSQRFTRQMLYFARLYILKSFMLTHYDIDISPVCKYINFYTKGLFRLYMLNISKVQNTQLTNDLILKIRELHFLYKTNCPVEDIDYTDFDNVARDVLIHCRNESCLTRDDYILERFQEIKKKDKEMFDRKDFITKYLHGLTYSLYDFDILLYIMKGVCNLEELKLDYIEQEFAVNNLDFLNLNSDTLVSRKSKKEVYLLYIKKWLEQGNKVPRELVLRYA